jgi:hypothetical protein
MTYGGIRSPNTAIFLIKIVLWPGICDYRECFSCGKIEDHTEHEIIIVNTPEEVS